MGDGDSSSAGISGKGSCGVRDDESDAVLDAVSAVEDVAVLTTSDISEECGRCGIFFMNAELRRVQFVRS